MNTGANTKISSEMPSPADTLNELLNATLNTTSETLDKVVIVGQQLFGFTVSSDGIRASIEQKDESLEDKMQILKRLSSEVAQITRDILERI